MNGRASAYFDLAFAMAIVGSSVVVGKLVVQSFPVFLALFMRFALGAAIMVPLALWAGGWPRLARRDLGLLFWQSFTGVFLFSVLLLWGLKYTTAAESGVITATTPACIAALSVLFLGERASPRRWVGIALAAIGILALYLPGEGTARGPAPMIGNLLVFGAVINEAAMTVIGKALGARVPHLVIGAGLSVYGAFLALPLALWQAVDFDFSGPDAGDWLVIVYYAVALSAVGYVLWYRGLKQVPASTAGVFTAVMPVSAVLLSYLVLDEEFRWSHLFGIVAVLAAIVAIAREER